MNAPALVLSLDAASRNSLARAVHDQIRTVGDLLANARTRPRPLELALSEVSDPVEARYMVEIDRLHGLFSNLTAVEPGGLAIGDAFYDLASPDRVFRVTEVSDDGSEVTARLFGIGLSEDEAVSWFEIGPRSRGLRRAIGAAYEP